ncbi:MAG: T9SS type A sorting domain-containing protein, partial [Flavobacteriales bacterium]
DYHTNATLCLPSRLVDNPNVNPPGEHSCNVERTASGQVWAPYRAGYRHFRYIWTPLDQQTSDDLIITRTNSNPQVSRILPLSGTATNTTYFIGQGTSTPGAAPASYGLGAWMVRVQTRRDAYNPWCDLGECCRVTIIEGFQDPPGEKNIELTGAQQPLVWPNPNSGRQLFMDLTWAKAKTVRVEVLDVFGRLVQDQQLAPQEGIPNSIQVRDRMSAGTYMVRITDGNEVRTTRLVISQ